ncbi:DUF305 domain-containing protein [Agromyces protaetiae]|uniref:DUF305 domain-containing protein n=1 Tax=Agromyces protaetiae TaxID=2509455 RepID=A0A4P6FF76_9MICO|nr:DUF305 domain-containing protein [Agromyces protaetiae]
MLLAVVALVAFTAGGHAATSAIEPIPTDTSADAGFARDMQVHHMQGVELAMIVRDLTDDEEVRRLAYDMATTQAQQAGQMYAWLEEWGLSQLGTEPSMAWTAKPAEGAPSGTHEHEHSADASEGAPADGGAAPGDPTAMPGYATPTQIDALRAATGVEAERMFLELMIAHHRGGVEMAEAAAARAQSRVVLTLADAIIASQNGEIALMEEMLAARS